MAPAPRRMEMTADVRILIDEARCYVKGDSRS